MVQIWSHISWIQIWFWIQSMSIIKTISKIPKGLVRICLLEKSQSKSGSEYGWIKSHLFASLLQILSTGPKSIIQNNVRQKA